MSSSEEETERTATTANNGSVDGKSRSEAVSATAIATAQSAEDVVPEINHSVADAEESELARAGLWLRHSLISTSLIL